MHDQHTRDHKEPREEVEVRQGIDPGVVRDGRLHRRHEGHVVLNDPRGVRQTNVDEGGAELDQSANVFRLAAIRRCEIDADAILELRLFGNEDERECRHLSGCDERVVLQHRSGRSHRDP